MVTELSPKVQASLAIVKTKILDLLEELKTPKSSLIES